MTELEKKVWQYLISTEPTAGDGWYYSEDIELDGMTNRQKAGVIASLSKKGFIETTTQDNIKLIAVIRDHSPLRQRV